MRNILKTFIALIFVSCAATQAYASDVQIIQASFVRNEKGSWNINVTLKHADEGWKHFANAWRVVDKLGNVLANRVLGHPHPHVNEQPFTRGLSNISISKKVQMVFIEAHDLKHGWAPKRLKVDMSQVVNGRLVTSCEEALEAID